MNERSVRMKNEDEKNEHIKLVTVFKTGDPAFISFAKSLLEAEGIIYYFKGEGLQNLEGAGSMGTGYNQLFGPVEIQVDAKDAQKAKEMLEQNEQAKFIMPENYDTDEKNGKDEKPESKGNNKTSVKGIFIGILIGIVIAVSPRYIYNAVEKYRQSNHSWVSRHDNNSDGKDDVIYYYENGSPVKIEKDRNFDGKTDLKSFYKNDIIDHIESDDNYDGVFERKTYYKNGITSREEFDDNDDKNPETVVNYIDGIIYNEQSYHESTHKIWRKILYQNGRMSEERIDLDGDGKFETLIKYNDYGRMISIARTAK
jgi:hypothetical protein